MALEVLDYWKMIEFLDQVDIPTETGENKKERKALAEGKKSKKKRIEIFTTVDGSPLNLETVLEENTYDAFPSKGNVIYFSLGNILRNDFVIYLERFLTNFEELPELAYPKNSGFAFFSLQTDLEGTYIGGSFRMSPLLWAVFQWEASLKANKLDFALDLALYEELLEEMEEKLEEKNITEVLAGIYGEIFDTYVKGIFPNLSGEISGFCEYNLYPSEEDKIKDDSATDYSDLGRSFFLSDICLLSEKIAEGTFGDKSPYEEKVMDYILSPYEKSKGMGDMVRTVISPKESRKKMYDFFVESLHVDKAPIGKWPSKFMPALMQQVAVNLSIAKNPDTSIFSVNGPPGTGKTTLLKEIVASNIVERAILLAESGEDADEAFVQESFEFGPLVSGGKGYNKFAPYYYSFKNDAIHDYGMLVASCNNAAVENITKDLPKGNDILDSLEIDEKDHPTITAGLEEIRTLFDVNKSPDIETITKYGKSKEEQDLYFTRYANRLLKAEDSWGLVSAPFGKKSNIKKYCDAVLKPYVLEYKSNDSRDKHKAKYKKERQSFLNQLAVVEKLKKELAVRSVKPPIKAEGDQVMTAIDDAFLDGYHSPEEKPATKAQVTNPWFTAKYNREREKLFFLACRLQKEFVLSSKCMRHNISNLLLAWNMSDDCDHRMQNKDREKAMPTLLQSVFIITPVISTTFASAQTFLKDIKCGGVLGTLIVDESGQAPPEMAVGSLFRCRKAMIVGDPKQIEPVVTATADMIKQLMASSLLGHYKDKKLSVQGCADYLNPYGTFLGEDEEQEWVGCPLVVHRRCIDPMYNISNVLSYDGTMKQQTGAPKPAKCETFILEKSCWLQVTGEEASGAKNHFVKAQGDVVLKLLEAKFKKSPEEVPNLFIISPFTSVKNGIVSQIRQSNLYKEVPMVKEWLEKNNVGTVHTFQGQGTDEVIFLLGCDPSSTGAANWVNKNIVNVAATRAKFRFYIIGDENVWTCQPVEVARTLTEVSYTVAELDVLLGLALPKEKPALAPATQVSAEKVAVKATITQDPVQKVATKAPTTQAPVKKVATKASITKTPSEKTATSEENLVCPKCGKKLVARTGAYGAFYGCSGFPACKHTQK